MDVKVFALAPAVVSDLVDLLKIRTAYEDVYIK